MGQTALVIGGGIAGLAAARVCCDHFARVILVERDATQEAGEPRAGVPQGRHLHVLLLRGKEILEGLFPGLCEEILEAGGVEVEQGEELLLFNKFGSWAERRPSGNKSINASRPLLEGLIRARLSKHPLVEWHAQTEVVELLWSEDGARVVGVQTRPRGHDARRPCEALHADLVIDASGARSALPDWLAAQGYARPEETTVDAFAGYASCLFEKPKDFAETWKWMLIWNQPPDNPRSGHIFEIEGGRWMVSLMGMARAYPPTDEEGFLAFAQSLSHPVLAETIRDATPLSPIVGYRDTKNVFRHYERLKRWPEGLLALGDAVCVFNPSYGQGMTVSAQAALLLEEHLRNAGAQRTLLGKQFQKKLAKHNKGPWMMATGEEVRWPTTQGAKATWMTRVQHAYVDKIAWLSQKMELARVLYGDVVNLTRSPAALFHPLLFLAACVWPMRTQQGAPQLPEPPPPYEHLSKAPLG